MKKLMPALFAAVALSTAAAIAQADVGPDEVIRLHKAGTIGDLEQFNKQALAKHTGYTIHDTELDNKAGRYVYEIELKDSKGTEWDYHVDAKTGEVLRDQQDR